MEFNDIQKIKRQFFACRNGITADALRKGGSPFRIIFGLDLPTLASIARSVGYNKVLAYKLWHNNSTRCSMLLAPMLIEPSDISAREIIEMVKESVSYEVTDVLCLKLISRHKDLEKIIDHLLEGEHMEQYAALRLLQRYIRKDNVTRKKYHEILSPKLSSTKDVVLERLMLSILKEE